MTTGTTPPPPPAYYTPQAYYAQPPAAKGPNPVGTVAFIVALVGMLAYIVVISVIVAGGMKIMQEEMSTVIPEMLPTSIPTSMPTSMPTNTPTTNPRAMFRTMTGAQKRIEKRVREFQLKPALQIPLWSSVVLGVVALILSIVAMRKPNARRGMAIAGLVIASLVCLCGAGGAITTLIQVALQ